MASAGGFASHSSRLGPYCVTPSAIIFRKSAGIRKPVFFAIASYALSYVVMARLYTA